MVKWQQLLLKVFKNIKIDFHAIIKEWIDLILINLYVSLFLASNSLIQQKPKTPDLEEEKQKEIVKQKELEKQRQLEEEKEKAKTEE